MRLHTLITPKREVEITEDWELKKHHNAVFHYNDEKSMSIVFEAEWEHTQDLIHDPYFDPPTEAVPEKIIIKSVRVDDIEQPVTDQIKKSFKDYMYNREINVI